MQMVTRLPKHPNSHSPTANSQEVKIWLELNKTHTKTIINKAAGTMRLLILAHSTDLSDTFQKGSLGIHLAVY